jgi:cell division protein FtsW (lipid II flippase)
MNIVLLVACVMLYLIGALLMMQYMEQWLDANPEEEFFFLTKKLDIIIIMFWFCFIVVAIIIEIFGPVKE